MTSRSVLSAGGQPGFSPGGMFFINLLKQLVSLQSTDGSYPSILDQNGFPVSAPSADIAMQTFISSSFSNDFTIDWTGKAGDGVTAAIRLDLGSPGFSVISGSSFVIGSTAFSLAMSGSNGSVRFSFASGTPSGVTFRFLSGGSFDGTLSSLRLYRTGDQSALNSGAIYNPDYLSLLRQLNPKILRFLDWDGANFCNVSKHSYRNPTTAITWASRTWMPGAWAGTVSGTDTYTVGNAPDSNPLAYVDKETIQATVTNANTSTTPTLNRNGLGAKTIVDSSATALSVGELLANSPATFVYDSTLDQFIGGTTGFTAFVPIEIAVALANAVSKDIWWNVSHLFDDASVTSLVTYVRNNLNSGLTFYLEYSNEIWNFSFAQTNYINAIGTLLGFASGDNRRLHGPYGKRFCEIMDLARTAWGGRTASELNGVIADQLFGNWGINAGTDKYRLQGFDLTAWGFDTAPNRPVDRCGTVSYATYYSGAQCRAFQAQYTGDFGAGLNINNLTAAADDYASGNASQMTSALNFLDNDFRAGRDSTNTARGETLEILSPKYVSINSVTAQYSNKYVRCYEGGLQALAPTTATCTSIGISTTYSTKIDALLTAYKFDGRL